MRNFKSAIVLLALAVAAGLTTGCYSDGSVGASVIYDPSGADYGYYPYYPYGYGGYYNRPYYYGSRYYNYGPYRYGHSYHGGGYYGHGGYHHH